MHRQTDRLLASSAIRSQSFPRFVSCFYLVFVLFVVFLPLKGFKTLSGVEKIPCAADLIFLRIRFQSDAHPIRFLCAFVRNFLRKGKNPLRRKIRGLLFLEFSSGEHLFNPGSGGENHTATFDRRGFYFVGGSFALGTQAHAHAA